MSHVITPSSCVVDGVVEVDRKAARVDDRFLRRLTTTLRAALVDFGSDGIPVLKDSFIRLDRSVTDEAYEADIWQFKAILKGPTTLTDKDLELFFAELFNNTGARLEPDDNDDSDRSPRVDLAETLVYMRRIFGHPTAQFHSILKKIRAKRPSFAESPFNVTAQPQRSAIYDYLIRPPLSLTPSEAFWVLEQCEASVKPGAAVDDANKELDVDYLVNCLFAFPLPDDVAYPLLLNKLTECVADGLRDNNGTAGVRRVLQRVMNGVLTPVDPALHADFPAAAGPSASPTPKKRGHGRFANEAAAGNDSDISATLLSDPGRVVGNIDATTFRSFCLVFGAGLSSTEADVLFQFIATSPENTIEAEDLVTILRDRLPLVSRHDIVRIAADVRQAIVSRNVTGLCDLHLALSAISADDAIPLGAYCAALRRAGVSPTAVVDVDLEHLHHEVPTCVSLLLLLRGNLPAPREAVIKKLFRRLDDDNSGLILRDRVLSCFEPELADAKLCARPAERKEALAQYLRTLPPNDAYIGYAEFSYFWGNISVGVPDDASFVMMVWQSYGLQRDGSRMMPQSTSRRRSEQSSVRGAHDDSTPPPRSTASSSSAAPSPTPLPPSEQRFARAFVPGARKEVPLTSAVPQGDDAQRPNARKRFTGR
jgi:Ca2+-binding EF-hand superfamily protein